MNEKSTSKVQPFPHSSPLVGAFLMLAAAFLFAVLDGLIKLLRPPFRVWDIAFYRFACGLVILVSIFGWSGNPFVGRNGKLLVLRGITGWFCLGGFLVLASAIGLNQNNARRISYGGFAGTRT